MNATGNNVPIIQQTVFYASSLEPATSTSHLAVTCTAGTCGAAQGGIVIGKFTGAGAIRGGNELWAAKWRNHDLRRDGIPSLNSLCTKQKPRCGRACYLQNQ